MNKALVWYFVCNLPICFTKNLSSEHGTKIEKLKNALVVSILNKESFCFLLKSFFELIIQLKAWKQLYDSESHGLSLNRFQSSLVNYKAPTIMFIYCNSGSLYCACSDEEYRYF